MKRIFTYFMVLSSSVLLKAQVSITQATGWLESAYVKWAPVSGAESYRVYYSGGGLTNKIIDNQLIRNYGSYFRADIPGLAAGNYTIKVVPVTGNTEGPAATTSSVSVLSHDRSGFAHSNGRVPGAYQLDGTLKSNAVVLYITESTKNTVSLNVTGANSNPCVGLQTILDGFKKGNDTRPLVIRFIGNIKDPGYLLNGDIVVENKSNASGSITLEGIGSDAVINGWGIRIKNATNIEVRNLGFMLTDAGEGDNLSLQQDNTYIWAHNNDLFYGKPGGDADQAKGDGALDAKKSTYITFSYNHFWDNGKSSLLGLSEGTTSGLYITYHHNWFDHSDSRHPRIRYYSAHVYNNYYDGNSKYGVGSTMGSSVFVEGNYFRNCKYPILTSKQGTDVANGSVGTFSGENGGVVKAFNNFMTGQNSFIPYSATASNQFDAYVSSSRNETLGTNIKAFLGGGTYNNFDTSASLYVSSLVPDAPAVARDKTMQYSGRVSGGDISWTFNNATDDTSDAVNPGLMALLQNYTSSLVSVQGESTAPVSQQTLQIASNNDQTVIPGSAITPMIFSWGGTAADVTVTGLPASGISFVKNMSAKTVTISGTPTADVDFSLTTSGLSGTPVSGTGSISVTSTTPNPQGSEIHNFTTSNLSSTFYSFSSANMNSTDGSATYDGLTLTKRLKLESSTTISYTTTASSTLNLVFDPAFTGTVKVDGNSYTAASGIVTVQNLAAGSHTITKGSVANLYYIKTQYSTTAKSTAGETVTEKPVIYPNPVQTTFTISSVNSIEQILISNNTGKIVREIKGNIKIIDISDLNSGIYFLSVKTSKGIFSQTLIKK